VPAGGLTHPAPESLFGKVSGRIVYVGHINQHRVLRRHPAPTHCVLTVIATDPPIRAQGVIGLSVDGLPSSVFTEYGHTASAQLVSQGWASGRHRKVAVAKMVARIQETVKRGELTYEWPQNRIARVGSQESRKLVMHDID